VPCSRVHEVDLAAFAVDPRSPEWAEFRDHFPRCADCTREVARFGALAAALRTENAGVSAHPSDAQLLALARAPAELVRDERARFEAHLAGCAPCRTELAAARGFAFAKSTTEAKRPGWLAGIGMAFAPLLRRPAFAAALAVALAVIATVLVRQTRETQPLPSPPPIAEVERSAPEPPPQAPLEEQPATPAPSAPPEPTQIAEQPVAEPPTVEQPPVEPPPVVAKPPPEIAAPEVETPEPAPAPPIQIAALLPPEPPRYAPGALASGASVRVGGGARNAGAGTPAPMALGPEHTGVSAHESPDLYWFLPATTPLSVEVSVVDPDADEPLLEQVFPGPLAAGVHRASLAEHGARLRPGVEYRWYVALVRDPARRSQDVVSGSAIRFEPPGSELESRLSAATPGTSAHVYAESGFWYDAFDQLSSWLADEPSAAVLHKHRAALLDQVGLADAAAFERRVAGPQ